MGQFLLKLQKLSHLAQVETLTCESRQSNPPPRLRWYLGDRELVGEQTNATEEGDARRWRATSALQHKFQKDDFGKSLACKVEPPAYSTGVRMATVVLDVLCKWIISFAAVYCNHNSQAGESALF